MSADVTKQEIRQLNSNLENVIGTLRLIEAEPFNEAEKLELFITCARILSRIGLWCTTLNHNGLPQFFHYCSYGYEFDIDEAVKWLLKYAEALLNESETMTEKVLRSSYHLNSDEAEDIEASIENDSSFEFFEANDD